MNKLLIPVLCVVLSLQSLAQRSQNKWQEHFSFANATKVVVTGSKVYSVTAGGLFYYNTDDNSINKITRINGLNDFGIRTIGWSQQHEVLLIAYNNSNIDLIKGSTVNNLPDIFRKQMTGDMNIYNIIFHEDDALLACGFGIVQVDLVRREIKETWFIGPDGGNIRVNDVEIFGNNIYAATSNGLLRADFMEANLADYRNWMQVNDVPGAGNMFSQLMVHAGSLVVTSTTGGQNGDALYRLTDAGWISYLPQIRTVSDAQTSGNSLTIAGASTAFVIDESHTVIRTINSYPTTGETIETIAPNSGITGGDGTTWLADNIYGLVRHTGQSAEYFFPEGPPDNRVFSLFENNGDLWVAPGGRDDSWTNIWQSARFQRFKDGRWTLFNQRNVPQLANFHDIVEIKTDPTDPDHIYVASWGGGLLEFRNGELINRFTNNNSPLQTALPDRPDEPYVRIGGLGFDSQNNLWITNSLVKNNLLKRSPAGEWEEFSLSEVTAVNIGRLIVTQDDDKWIQVPRGNDVYVVNADGSQQKHVQVTSYFSNGQQEIINRMNDVYAIAEDLDGAIWIGTSKGVAVYNNPQGIWDPGGMYAIQPGLNLNDGLYHPLLETETITAIAVDGANRKWMGTRNSGVYLVSEAGDHEVLHFNSDNSPLPSNNITSLAINKKSGIIYIGTSEGLVSYTGDAIAGEDTYANVYVYPNPVRETWDGPVTITGLIEETDIKITDIAGNLVHQSTSLGGQAVWDGKNLNGNRVRTGVYLILCTDRFGEETHIEKLLFIN